MPCSPTSERDNWPTVTGAKSATAHELIAAGLERREARWLLEAFAGRDGLEAAVRRRLDGAPLQYVIGHWPFRSLELDVDERALIPRPETEELVGRAIAALAGRTSAPSILDLGCGSGAIGLALLAELRERAVAASLVALDRSPDCLALARTNARKHGLDAVAFVEGSWYDGLDPSLARSFDLIVANPPYVGALEYDELDDVVRHEPRTALVAPDADGVAGFADLATVIGGAPAWLASGGALVVEHGHRQREAARRAALAARLVDVETYDDLAGHPRILVARRP